MESIAYLVAALLGAYVGALTGRAYAAAISLAVLLSVIVLPVASRRTVLKSAAILVAAAVASSGALSSRVPAAMVSAALAGETPDSPMAFEVFSMIVRGEYSPALEYIAAFWGLYVTAAFLTAYAVFLLFRHLWVSAEKAPYPLPRVVTLVPPSLLARSASTGALSLGSAIAVAALSKTSPGVSLAALALVAGLTSTVSFLAAALIGAAASVALGESFSLGVQVTTVALSIVIASLVHRYHGYEVTLPAPAILLMIAVLLSSPFLVMVGALKAPMLLAPYMATLVASSVLLLRAEGEYTLALAAELTLVSGFAPLLSIQKAASPLGLAGGLGAAVLYPLAIPEIYLAAATVAVLLGEAGESRSFRGIAPVAAVFAVCSVLSAYRAARSSIGAPATTGIPSVPGVQAVNVAALVAGVAAAVLVALLYLSGETRVPLSPAGLVFGTLLAEVGGAYLSAVLVALAASLAVKTVLVAGRKVSAGALAQHSSSLLWGAMLGLLMADVV